MAGLVLTFTLGAALAAVSGAAVAEDASGTASYQANSGPIVVTVKHAYLVKGPDAVSGLWPTINACSIPAQRSRPH
jgi:hypothetical protein